MKIESLAHNIGDARLIRFAADKFDFTSRAEFARFFNGKIKTAESALCKSLDDVVLPETNAEFETRHTRLCNDKLCFADAKTISDIDISFQQSSRCQILAKHSKRQIHFGKFTAPEFVMLERISINGFVITAVNTQIHLRVAFQIRRL